MHDFCPKNPKAERSECCEEEPCSDCLIDWELHRITKRKRISYFERAIMKRHPKLLKKIIIYCLVSGKEVDLRECSEHICRECPFDWDKIDEMGKEREKNQKGVDEFAIHD